MIVSFEQLLEVQKLDTTLAQLQHARSELPERSEIAQIEAELATTQSSADGVQSERDGMAKVQKRHEDEIALVEAKLAGINEKLYGGGITSPKEAQTLQEEIASFERQRGAIEDQVIEQMVLAEPLDFQLAEFAESTGALSSSLEESQQRLLAGESEINSEIADVEAQRDASAADVPPELLAEYRGAREEFGSSAVVVLDGPNCKGCPLAMPAMEVDRAKKAPDDELYTCEECGRFVVK